MERAFSDFTAIAPPDWKKPWREVFDVKLDWRGDITALYREKARSPTLTRAAVTRSWPN